MGSGDNDDDDDDAPPPPSSTRLTTLVFLGGEASNADLQMASVASTDAITSSAVFMLSVISESAVGAAYFVLCGSIQQTTSNSPRAQPSSIPSPTFVH